MSFSELENSRNQGVPIELYLFRYGLEAGQLFAFTDAERPFIHDGITYEPKAISRGDDSSGGNRDRKDMTISLFSQNPLLDLFNIYPPDHPISLVIRSGHLNDASGEFRPIYSGRVLNVSTGEASESSITCRTNAASGSQAGLRRHYQYGCPHVLYGSQCRASKAAVSRDVAVVEVGLASITLTADWFGPIPATKYIGGVVQFVDGVNLSSRKILRLSNESLTLSLTGPTGLLAVGGVVTVAPGCNLQDTDCDEVHDNILNFGGQPWIPLENPISSNNIF